MNKQTKQLNRIVSMILVFAMILTGVATPQKIMAGELPEDTPAYSDFKAEPLAVQVKSGETVKLDKANITYKENGETKTITSLSDERIEGVDFKSDYVTNGSITINEEIEALMENTENGNLGYYIETHVKLFNGEDVKYTYGLIIKKETQEVEKDDVVFTGTEEDLKLEKDFTLTKESFVKLAVDKKFFKSKEQEIDSSLITVSDIKESDDNKYVKVTYTVKEGETTKPTSAQITFLKWIDPETIQPEEWGAPKITVKDENIFLIEVSEKGPVDFSKAFTAKDYAGNDLTDTIEIDSSDVKYQTVGKYEIRATVKDKYGNVANFTQEVEVYDENDVDKLNYYMYYTDLYHDSDILIEEEGNVDLSKYIYFVREFTPSSTSDQEADLTEAYTIDELKELAEKHGDNLDVKFKVSLLSHNVGSSVEETDITEEFINNNYKYQAKERGTLYVEIELFLDGESLLEEGSDKSIVIYMGKGYDITEDITVTPSAKDGSREFTVGDTIDVLEGIKVTGNKSGKDYTADALELYEIKYINTKGEDVTDKYFNKENNTIDAKEAGKLSVTISALGNMSETRITYGHNIAAKTEDKPVINISEEDIKPLYFLELFDKSVILDGITATDKDGNELDIKLSIPGAYTDSDFVDMSKKEVRDKINVNYYGKQLPQSEDGKVEVLFTATDKDNVSTSIRVKYDVKKEVEFLHAIDVEDFDSSQFISPIEQGLLHLEDIKEDNSSKLNNNIRQAIYLKETLHSNYGGDKLENVSQFNNFWINDNGFTTKHSHSVEGLEKGVNNRLDVYKDYEVGININTSSRPYAIDGSLKYDVIADEVEYIVREDLIKDFNKLWNAYMLENGLTYNTVLEKGAYPELDELLLSRAKEVVTNANHTNLPGWALENLHSSRREDASYYFDKFVNSPAHNETLLTDSLLKSSIIIEVKGGAMDGYFYALTINDNASYLKSTNEEPIDVDSKDLDFKVIEKETDTLFEGETKVEVEGKKGIIEESTYLATNSHDKDVKIQVISKYEKPQDRIVLVGTKKKDVEEDKEIFDIEKDGESNVFVGETLSVLINHKANTKYEVVLQTSTEEVIRKTITTNDKGQQEFITDIDKSLVDEYLSIIISEVDGNEKVEYAISVESGPVSSDRKDKKIVLNVNKDSFTVYEELNLDELETLIAQAKEIDTKGKTKESVDNLESAIVISENLLNAAKEGHISEQSAIDNAVASIKEAIDNLQDIDTQEPEETPKEDMYVSDIYVGETVTFQADNANDEEEYTVEFTMPHEDGDKKVVTTKTVVAQNGVLSININELVDNTDFDITTNAQIRVFDSNLDELLFHEVSIFSKDMPGAEEAIKERAKHNLIYDLGELLDEPIVELGNMEELLALITKSKELNLDNKTESSIENFNKVLKEALDFIELPDLTQDKIDNMTNKLQNAIDSLEDIKEEPEEPQVDTAKLEKLLSEAVNISSKGKTEESVAKLAKAIKDAQDLLAKEDKTQVEVDAALVSLRMAIDGLEDIKEEPEEPEVDITKLEKLVDKAKNIDKDKYTSKSQEQLNDIISEALSLLDKEELSEEEVDSMVASLNEALDKLVKRGNIDFVKKAIEDVKEKITTEHTKESIDNLYKTIKKAEDMISKDVDNLTEEDVTNMISELLQSAEELVLIDEANTDDDKDDNDDNKEDNENDNSKDDNQDNETSKDDNKDKDNDNGKGSSNQHSQNTSHQTGDTFGLVAIIASMVSIALAVVYLSKKKFNL